MSSLRRFRGSMLALGALVGLGLVYAIATDVFDPPVQVAHTPDLFRFEKEDLVGIKVVRPDTTVEIVQKEGDWHVVGESWKPSRSMVRRVAHQIHDLTARAVVDADAQDPELYGVGEGAIRVTLTLKDGRTIEFQAGDPNPSSVSWYVRPIPGDDIYVVKKSAVDYYRLSLEEFRERRFAWLDADDADRIEATIDGQAMAFHRTGDKSWKMTTPIEQPANREEIRTMLGRTGALKASTFVQDNPEAQDLAKYGLEPAKHRVKISMSTGESITLLVGDVVPGTDPEERYVFREEDNAIYQARSGFLEAFQLPPEGYRNRDILGKHEWDVQSMLVKSATGQEVRLDRTGKAWHWPDGSPVPGSTPSRVAGRAAEISAKAFHDEAIPPDAGLDPAFATIELTFADGVRVVTVGNERVVRLEASPFPAPPGAPERPTEERRRYVRVDGDPAVYEVDGSVGSVVEDLFREYGRKLERDAEKRVYQQAEQAEQADGAADPE